MTDTEIGGTLITKTGEEIDFVVTPDEEVPKVPTIRHAIRPHENHHLEKFFKGRVWAEVSGQELVDLACVQKLEITALCGWTWIPVLAKTDGLKTCDACVDMMNLIMGVEG